MLVLSRKKNQDIIIGSNITITILEVRGDKVRLGIKAPEDISVHRKEVFDAIKSGQQPNTPILAKTISSDISIIS